jgi:GGDEF domain-containing protein
MLRRVGIGGLAREEQKADLVAHGGQGDGHARAHTLLDVRRQVEGLELPGVPSSAAITVSVGAATVVPDHEKSPEDLVRRADASLYVAKHQGRNLVRSSPGIEVPKGFFQSDA